MSTEQQSFELELDAPEKLYYPFGERVTHCRDCRRPLAGRHTLASEGAGPEGHYMICDDCVRAAAKARYDAAPFRDCGKHKAEPYDFNAHADECWELVCPHCGVPEMTPFVLQINHMPDAPYPFCVRKKRP